MGTDASRTRVRARALAVAIMVVGLAGLAVDQPPARADVDVVSGMAYAARVNTAQGGLVPPTPAGVAGTASEGGDPAFDTGLVPSIPVSIPGVISIGVLHARTVGGGVAGENHLASVTSSGHVAGVSVSPTDLRLPPITLNSATARCTSDGDGSHGDVQISGGQAGGTRLPESPGPGTTIVIPDVARIVLNEQTVVNIPGVRTSIVVNAVHIELLSASGGPPIRDIVLGHVECAAEGPNVLVATTTAPTTSTTVAQADLSLAKTCDPGPVAPGMVVNCSVTVSNAGPSAAEMVSVSDDLPTGMSLLGTPSGDGFTCATGDPFTCVRPSLGANASATFTLAVRVGNVAPGSSLTNTATVSSTTADPDRRANAATATTGVVSCGITGAGLITGTSGDDVICGSAGPDRIAGLGGNDVIFGVGGDDQIMGGDGDDALLGGDGADSLSGDNGSDELFGGGGGIDRLSGGTGDDLLDTVDGTTDDFAAGGDHDLGDSCTVDPGDSTALCEASAGQGPT